METKRINKSVIFWLLFLSYVTIYMARLNLSMASPALRESGVLNAAQLGFIGSAFSVIYSCGRLFNGILGDRLAPKVMILTGLVFTGIANLTIGFLPPYGVLLVLWSINAFAQSMLWSSLIRTVSSLYDKKQAGDRVSILVSSVSVGNILGILVTPLMITHLGLRFAFIVPGVLTILAAMAVLYIVPAASKEGGKAQAFPWKTLLTDKKVRGILLPAMFHGTMKDNISLFMAIYFADKFFIDLESSAWYVLLIPVVGLVGRLAYPLCYKLSKRRENMISILAFGLSAVLAAVLCLPGGSPLLAAVCLSLIYALVSMINTSFLSMLPLHFAEKGLVASVSGITDFATYLGAGIAAAIYGVWIEGGMMGYTFMFVSWAVLSVISIVILLFQNPFKIETFE